MEQCSYLISLYKINKSFKLVIRGVIDMVILLDYGMFHPMPNVSN